MHQLFPIMKVRPNVRYAFLFDLLQTSPNRSKTGIYSRCGY